MIKASRASIFRVEALILLLGIMVVTLPADGWAGMWPRRLRGHLTITRTCAYSNGDPANLCGWTKTESIAVTQALFRRATSPFPVMYLPISGTLAAVSDEYRDCTYPDPYNSSNYCLESISSHVATGSDQLGANGEWVDFSTNAGRWTYEFMSPNGTTLLTEFVDDSCLGNSMPFYQEPFPLTFEARGKGVVTRTATSFVWKVNKSFTSVYIGVGGVCQNKLQGRLTGVLR